MTTSILFALFSGFLIEWFGLRVVYAVVAGIAALATAAATMIQEERSRDRFSVGVFWTHVCTIASVFRIRPYLKILAFVALSSFSFDLTGAMTYWYNGASFGARASASVRGGRRRNQPGAVGLLGLSAPRGSAVLTAPPARQTSRTSPRASRARL